MGKNRSGQAWPAECLCTASQYNYLLPGLAWPSSPAVLVTMGTLFILDIYSIVVEDWPTRSTASTASAASLSDPGQRYKRPLLLSYPFHGSSLIKAIYWSACAIHLYKKIIVASWLNRYMASTVSNASIIAPGQR